MAILMDRHGVPRELLWIASRIATTRKVMPTHDHESNHQLIENQQHLAQWVRQSKGPLDMAVAFWGEGAVKELGLKKLRAIRVLLELQSGGTNPAEVRLLMKLPHVEVKQLPRLHAKAYISRDSVLIGSANASANGLGSEGSESTRWHELAVRTSEASVVCEAKSWFEKKWAAGHPIKPSQLGKAEREWKERQRIRPKVGSDAKDILAAALNNPGEFRNRGLFVVVTTRDWNKKGYADARDYKEKHSHEALGWQGWTDIPKNATLICFTDYKGEGFHWDEPRICYSPGKLNPHESLVLVSSTTLDDGFKPGDIRKWTKALAAVKGGISKQEWSANGMCKDLGEFAGEVRAQTEF